MTSPINIDALLARDLDVLWHPTSQMRDYIDFPPLPVTSAEGCLLTLADGRQIYDAISSWWCKSLGHRHPRLTAALKDQADQFEHVILANTTNEPAVHLCERLLAAANGLPPSAWGAGAAVGKRRGHFGRVFFADNGSTAVEIALKMAVQAQSQRGNPNRTHFAALKHGYHGETIATLAVGDMGIFGDPFRKLMFPATMIDAIPYRSGPSDPQWLDASDAWPAIEAQLAPIAGQLAAIIYEPVLQGAGGMKLYSPDLLGRFRGWADAHSVYLIADEIAAGMGRLGAMLASHLAPNLAALPDFAVVSKGLTGGYLPFAAVLTTDAVYDIFHADYVEMRGFLHSNTYTGNALAIAVAHAVLDVFAEEDVLGQVARRGPILHAGMRELTVGRPYLRNSRGCGMMAAVDICQSDGSPLDWKQRSGYRVYQEAVRRGALLRPVGDTMYILPPLNTSESDIHAMIGILADSLAAVLGS